MRRGIIFVGSIGSIGILGVFIYFFLLPVLIKPVLCQESNQELDQEKVEQARQEFVGKLFGIQVPAGNYIFVRGVLAVFGNPWGPPAKTEKALTELIWEQLLLSYEAHRLGVTISQYELDEEIKTLLRSEKVDFDYKSDKEAYSKWIRDKASEDIELFENQLKHLLQIKKLREQIMDSLHPQVTHKEAYEEFLNEHNSLSLELFQFDTQKEAKEFYKQARSKRELWDEEKEKGELIFQRTGLVALEFLIEIWKLPKDAVYDMINMREGRIYRPCAIYNGFAVFKVMGKKHADKKRFPKLKDYYYNQIRDRKKKISYNDWFQDLKQKAKIEVYKN